VPLSLATHCCLNLTTPFLFVTVGRVGWNLLRRQKIYGPCCCRLRARLFARSQSASKAAIESQENTEDASWPASSHNPENTSALLQRFLVFLGVEEQKARGILSEAQARAALDNATVRSNASGSELIINRSYRSSFNQLLSVIQQLDGYTLTSSDDSLGRIEVQDATTSVVLELSPIHVSAVSVSLVACGLWVYHERGYCQDVRSWHLSVRY